MSFSPAPSAPTALNYTAIAPGTAHGPMINITWSKPQNENGIIVHYTVIFRQHGCQQYVYKNLTASTFSYSIDVLGGVNYSLIVRAATIKNGRENRLSVNVPEYG